MTSSSTKRGREDSNIAKTVTSSRSVIATGKGQRVGFWDRLLAFGVDCVVVYFVSAMFGSLPYFFVRNEHLEIVYPLVSCAYSTLFNGAWGQTPGKRIFFIRLERANGQRLGYGRAFLRFWAKTLSFLPLTFWVVFCNNRRRAIHDWIAGSVVVRAQSLTPLDISPSTSSKAAGFWARAAALTLDAVVVGTFGAAFLLVVSSQTKREGPDWTYVTGVSIAGIGYNWLFTRWWNGTPGKLAFELGVFCANGRPIGSVRALARHFAIWWPFFALLFAFTLPRSLRSPVVIALALAFVIDCVTAAFDKQKRALHDRICGTRVIQLE